VVVDDVLVAVVGELGVVLGQVRQASWAVFR
jgi:hypothetical protein